MRIISVIFVAERLMVSATSGGMFIRFVKIAGEGDVSKPKEVILWIVHNVNG